MRRRLAIFFIAGSLYGCRGQRSEAPPIVPIRNMYSQPRYNPQAESPFFRDRRTMREPVPGTVPRGAVVSIEESQGLQNDGQTYVDIIPQTMVNRFRGLDRMLVRGQNRFNIYCTPCHGRLGDGEGMVVKRGMLKPTSFHDDRLRHAPDGQIFATMSNGIRNMPPYRSQVSVQDRWAIVSYIRALQTNLAPKLADTTDSTATTAQTSHGK